MGQGRDFRERRQLGWLLLRQDGERQFAGDNLSYALWDDSLQDGLC